MDQFFIRSQSQAEDAQTEHFTIPSDLYSSTLVDSS